MCSKISTSLCNTSGSGQQHQHQQQQQRNLIERNSTGSVVVGVSESSNCEFGDWSGNSDCIDKPRGSSSSDSAMPKPAESSKCLAGFGSYPKSLDHSAIKAPIIQ